MKVRDGMTRDVVSVGPSHTLREAAKRMSARRVGAAVVVDHSQPVSATFKAVCSLTKRRWTCFGILRTK